MKRKEGEEALGVVGVEDAGRSAAKCMLSYISSLSGWGNHGCCKKKRKSRAPMQTPDRPWCRFFREFSIIIPPIIFVRHRSRRVTTIYR